MCGGEVHNVSKITSIIYGKNKQPHPSKNKLTVSFREPFPVYTGKAFASSLKLCNHHMDTYPKHIIGAIDSAATDHFMPHTYTGDAPRAVNHGITVGCANGSQMQATGTDVLAIPQLP